MKSFYGLCLIVLMVLVFNGCTGVSSSASQNGPKPQLMVAGKVKLDKKGTVEITGKGFEPNSEVIFLFTAVDGVQSDIGYALDPLPKAGNSGTLSTKWSYGRYVSKKLVSEGSFTITAADQDYNVLCETSIVFVK